MKIERMTEAHLDAVAELERECFAHPWSRESLKETLRSGDSLFYIAELDGRVIGYIGMSFVLDEGYIYNVAVEKSSRKKGAGSALIQTLVNYGKKNGFAFLTLEVRESNTAARSLYSSFGFIKVGERKKYYSDPVDNAVLMTLYF